MMSVLACELDPPTPFDFVLLYFKLLRLHLQALRGPISKEAMNIILTAEYLSSEFCKMTLADIGLMQVRPSILGAAALDFGIRGS
jgi:hypothetical protein